MRIAAAKISDAYFAARRSDAKIGAAKRSYEIWLTNTRREVWETSRDVKAAHPKASILKGGRVVFNIKGNDYRLICWISYEYQTVEVRWFGSHAEYDKINAETI